MKKPTKLIIHRRVILALLLVFLLPAAAYARTYRLRADIVEKTMPDGTVVKMWGFADDTDVGDGNGTVTVPGPELVLPPGDTTLTIYLKNNLTALNTGLGKGCPLSLIIPGQYAPLSPVRFNAATDPMPVPEFENRVRSLTHETPSDNTTVGVYSWSNLKPGTYLYHSGTHIQCHVQMGLYGAMKVYAADGNPYPGVTVDREITLLYSEIDPAFHATIASGQYGPGKAVTSTLNYKPKYFLINGQPHYPGRSPLVSFAPGQKLLLRFINAGLDSHVPTLQNAYLDFIAEDGYPYPFKKTKYSELLAAGKTLDAVFLPAQAGLVAVYDRMLNLTNNGMGPGGMLCYLQVAAVTGTPVAVADAYAGNEDAALNVPAPGILANDSDPDGDPLTIRLLENVKNGVLALQADGSFTYIPDADFYGSDFFTYMVTDGALNSSPAVVTVNVAAVNDMPMAMMDTAVVEEGSAVDIDVLANDMDADMDMLNVTSLTSPQHGTAVLNTGNTVTYTPAPGFTGADSFTYRASDGLAVSAAATVTVTVNPHINLPPVANNDTVATGQNIPVTINVLANDTDTDGVLVPSTVTVVTQPLRRGTVQVNANGTITYTPARNFRGTDLFTYRVQDDDGSFSNTATVRVNVTR